MRRIPPQFSRKWLTFGLFSSVLIFFFIVIARFVILRQDFDLYIALRLIVFSVVLATIYSTMGWLGWVRMWVCSITGYLLGIVLMVYFSRGTTGWEDLIGFLVLIQLIVAGIVLGIVVEVVRVLYVKLKRTK